LSSSHSTQTTFQRFVESEAAVGLVLMASAALGLVGANSPLAGTYADLLHARVAGLDVLHWINDGLMALFFLLVGLEIKREMVEGQLDTWPSRALPLIAALGGMLVPALIFMAVNASHPENWRGWAVPTATDIAFALGVLSLLGARVPLAQGVSHLARHHGRPCRDPDHRNLLCLWALLRRTRDRRGDDGGAVWAQCVRRDTAPALSPPRRSTVGGAR
jgi:Na+/H+ antiporter NhaA